MNDELYEYINKKKQSVVKQYDLLLERIQLSKNPKSAIALMCDEEFIVREPQYPISELLDLMSVLLMNIIKTMSFFKIAQRRSLTNTLHMQQKNTVFSSVLLFDILRRSLFDIMQNM